MKIVYADFMLILQSWQNKKLGQSIQVLKKMKRKKEEKSRTHRCILSHFILTATL